MNQFYNTQGSYYYPQANQLTVQNRAPSGINWVNGEEGAKAWVMAPNSNVILMDSMNDGRFYIKTCDSIGMCNLRMFNYKEVINVQPVENANTVQYATKQDIKELRDLIDSMRGVANEQSVQPAQFSVANTY